MKRLLKNLSIPIALLLGSFTGALQIPFIDQLAHSFSDLFMNLLRLIAVPLVFLSITSTITRMEGFKEMKSLGFKTLKYTIFTTLIAASVALVLLILIDPTSQRIDLQDGLTVSHSRGYLDVVKKIIPSNLIEPFIENNVIAIAFLAFLFSIATLALPTKNKETIHQLFSSLFAVFLKITGFIVKTLPLAIWAFTSLLTKDLLTHNIPIQKLSLYLLCVISANLIQGLIVLPLLLKWKKISPVKLFRSMFEALTIAFFTKSSNAAMPIAMRCAEQKFQMKRRVSSFTFPLCSVINMNACAAFILITVLYVSMQNGIGFSLIQMIGWVFLATIAAIGNAGVPMGCFFLATAFLSSMGIPLKLMGLILPFYALLDMLETAINVWSDSCISASVDQDLKAQKDFSLELDSLEKILD